MSTIVDNLKYFWLFVRKANFDSANFYQLVGKDHTWGNENLCLNLGYWKNSVTMDEANLRLVEEVSRVANLEEDDDVLDVGCGFGHQDLHIMKHFPVKKITGLNISGNQVDYAREMVVRKGAVDKINFVKGSATDMPFSDESFDKIIGVESAFHFQTRKMFFNESYRVLKPGGTLAVADIIFNPKKCGVGNYLSYHMHKVSLHYQKENMYGVSDYIKFLEESNFVDVKVWDISFFVFPFFYKYVHENPDIFKRFFFFFRIWLKYSKYLPSNHEMKYVIIKARKS